MDKNKIYEYFSIRSALVKSAQNYVDSVFKQNAKIKLKVVDIENFGNGMVRIITDIHVSSKVKKELDSQVPVIISVETLSKY